MIFPNLIIYLEAKSFWIIVCLRTLVFQKKK